MRDNAFTYSSNNLKHFQQPQACRPADMPHVYQSRYICSLLHDFITFQLEHQDYYIVYVQQRAACPSATAVSTHIVCNTAAVVLAIANSHCTSHNSLLTLYRGKNITSSSIDRREAPGELHWARLWGTHSVTPTGNTSNAHNAASPGHYIF